MAFNFMEQAKAFLAMGRPVDAAVCHFLLHPEVVDNRGSEEAGIRGRAFHYAHHPGIYPEMMAKILGIKEVKPVECDPKFKSVTDDRFKFINDISNAVVRNRLTTAIALSDDDGAAVSVIHIVCVFEDFMRRITGSRDPFYGTVLATMEELVDRGTGDMFGTIDPDLMVEMLQCAGTMREEIAHNNRFDPARVLADLQGLLTDDEFVEVFEYICSCY